MAFDMPARQSFVVEIASREDLMNAISLNSAMFNGARIIGPADCRVPDGEGRNRALLLSMA